MRIEYTCKFCRAPGWVDCDIAPEITIQTDVWRAMLCCNRCGDFMVERRKLTESISKVCRIIGVVRSTMRETIIRDTETKAFEKLEFLTKRFSRLVCDYYKKTAVWEPEFPRMILEHPEQVNKVLNDYFRMCRTV